MRLFCHNRHGPKIGDGAGSHLTQSRLGCGLSPYQVALDKTNCLATIEMGRKLVRGCARFLGRELGPHLAQCDLDQGLYLRAECRLDPPSPLTTMDMGRKLGRGLCPHSGEGIAIEAFLHAKFHLDSTNRLSTLHQRHRETDMTSRTGQTTV